MQTKPKFIEKQFSIGADLYFGLYGFLVAVFISVGLTALGATQIGLLWGTTSIICVLIVAISIGRHVRLSKVISKRNASLQLIAAQHQGQWEFNLAPNLPSEFTESSLLDLANCDLNCTNYIKTTAWSYIDLTYAVYQRTRNGEFKQATIYYAVMATPLPRILPNVLFASKQDRGRQFKAKFAADQRHELEGDFNKYFDTYFAEGYTIDSLSFITPDVMQKLISASDYDIEIIGDELLLYGPMYAADVQLDEMINRITDIKSQLLENIDVYRDDRLPEQIGRHTVTAQGMFLQQRKAHATVGILIIVAYIVIRLFFLLQPH